MKKFHFCLFIAVPVLAASYSVSAGDPKMKIFKNAQEMELDSFGKGGNAFLTDVVTSTGAFTPRCNALTIADAIAPVPHAPVSPSTPRSNVADWEIPTFVEISGDLVTRTDFSRYASG